MLKKSIRLRCAGERKLMAESLSTSQQRFKLLKSSLYIETRIVSRHSEKSSYWQQNLWAPCTWCLLSWLDTISETQSHLVSQTARKTQGVLLDIRFSLLDSTARDVAYWCLNILFDLRYGVVLSHSEEYLLSRRVTWMSPVSGWWDAEILSLRVIRTLEQQTSSWELCHLPMRDKSSEWVGFFIIVSNQFP